MSTPRQINNRKRAENIDLHNCCRPADGVGLNISVMKHREKERLVVVSKRTPTLSGSGSKEEKVPKAAGGLVSALYPALQEKGGLWFGWSGQAVPRQKHSPPRILRRGSIEFVTVDLSEEEVNDFYT